MRRSLFLPLAAVASVVTLGTAVAMSQTFPDVGPSNPHFEHIESQAAAGVIKGYPDGNFGPNDELTRAALAVMLYRAKGIYPDPNNVKCFKDTIPESWYEAAVCDGVKRGFWNGFPDGTFGPALAVKRVEGVKMTATVFGLTVDSVTDAQRDTVTFVDTSRSAWYTDYLYAFFSKGILPLPGMDGSRFYPDQALTRAETASLIDKAAYAATLEHDPFHEEEQEEQEQEEEEDDEQNEQDDNDEDDDGNSATESRSNEQSVIYPFSESGQFEAKKPELMQFTMTTPETVFVEVEVGEGAVTCRLYHLKESGFSDEYFLGVQEGSKCYIHATVNPGNYQLQVQPSQADATYTASAIQKDSDGSDGFRNATRLYPGNPKTSELATDDLSDWYMFVIQDATTMTLTVSPSVEIGCTVYPMSDVDLFGFSLPNCNEAYEYPAGTYYVSVMRKIGSKTMPKDYTIVLSQ